MANLGVLTALLGRHGEVFADKLNHASLVDAAQLSGAAFTRYRHIDLAQLEGQLAASRAQDKVIASDLVFSMDGDIAPVDALLDLAEHYDAWLYLDDAHGFGVLNDGRGGLTERARTSDRVIYLATLGKAAGVAGAAVAAHASVIDWLIQKARPYIYTTASPPLLAACLLESLRQIEAGEARRERLGGHIEQLRAGLADLKCGTLMDSTTPIQPLLIGENADAVRLSQNLLQRGLLVPAIRTPTVPAGTARLRITLSAAHSADDVAQLIEALHAID
jgi:8-amino-7-oxononanoate synthase